MKFAVYPHEKTQFCPILEKMRLEILGSTEAGDRDSRFCKIISMKTCTIVRSVIYGKLLLVVLGQLMSTAWAQMATEQKLVYKYVNSYEWIWDDRNSGANRDVSIWRPIENTGFFAVADVAVLNYDRPAFYSFMVRDESGKTIRPNGFTLIWKDSGSGASADVAIYSITCPSGYSALGSVAVGSYSSLPNSATYR